MSQTPHEDTIDEAALDAELAASIEKVKSGEVLQAQDKPEAQAPTETPETTTPPVDEKVTGEENGTPQESPAKGEPEYRLPNQGKFESDEAYEKRVELFDLVKRRKAAASPEAKQALSEQISKTKGELKHLGLTERINNPKEEPTKEEVLDPALLADQERLKQLGGATKDDLEQMIRKERIEQEVKSDLAKFVDRTKELQDPDVREVFFDFVDANYIWQGKSGKELITVLELARENMFRPSESIQDRVLKGAGVQEKVNAMQFPGGTGAEVGLSPEMRRSVDELKATGMSEDKAIELLSE
jgi:hypothetical protein